MGGVCEVLKTKAGEKLKLPEPITKKKPWWIVLAFDDEIKHINYFTVRHAPSLKCFNILNIWSTILEGIE